MAEGLDEISFFGLLFKLEKDPDSGELKGEILKRLEAPERGEKLTLTGVEKALAQDFVSKSLKKGLENDAPEGKILKLTELLTRVNELQAR